jgi:hypothetical protein
VSPNPFEVFAFRSVGDAIGRALRVDPAPDCQILHGRTILTFRRLGASRWPEPQQMEFALRASDVARAVLADDKRRQVRKGATRAIVIAFKDAAVVEGCIVRFSRKNPAPHTGAVGRSSSRRVGQFVAAGASGAISVG